MIKNLAHVCFVVSDLEKALDFYRDTLDLQEAFDFKNEEGEQYGVYLHVGGRNFIELFKGDVEESEAQHSYRHLCLEVDDIEETAADLRDRGLEVSPVKMGKDHSYQAWITDPDGNRIELHQYTPESWQAPSLG